MPDEERELDLERKLLEDTVVADAADTVTDSPEKALAAVPSEAPAPVPSVEVYLQSIPRSAEAVEREEELRGTFSSAAERSRWGPRLDPQDRDEDWNGRHQLLWHNDGLNPNCRSYFDRWLESKELLPADAKEQPQKCIWRLSLEAQSMEQRQEERNCLSSFSPVGGGLRASPEDKRSYLEPEDIVTERKAMRLSRDKPWETAPVRFWNLPKKEQPASKMKAKAKPKPAKATEGLEPPEAQRERAWNDHHHVMFSNHRNLQGELLNPMMTRDYFDRHREPAVGARSAEFKPEPPEGEQVSIVRVVPVWRLDPAPGGGQVPEVGSLCPRTPPLFSRSGTGGDPASRGEVLGPLHSASPHFNHKSTWAFPTHPSESSPSKSKFASTDKRIRKWESRHSLLFKNEEVSRLDRSYFDRFRDHPEIKRKKEAIPNCGVWSLERSASPEESARQVAEASNARNRPCGSWNSRHEIFFDNTGAKLPVHQNLRSYFDRWREPAPSARLPGEEAAADDDPNRAGYFAQPTEAAESRRRKKLNPDQKLKVEVWSLVEKSSGPKALPLEATFRRCESDPGMHNAKTKHKRRRDWFSSHNVVF
mmetsp:Transcript_96801/g.172209  ORF Transcript_96801/g.172209 Transcript_96801/m.172209 type:complete len:591 (+) Transcript_96801:56-1828(+)